MTKKERIEALEAELQALKDEVAEIKAKPPTTYQWWWPYYQWPYNSYSYSWRCPTCGSTSWGGHVNVTNSSDTSWLTTSSTAGTATTMPGVWFASSALTAPNILTNTLTNTPWREPA